MGTRVSVKLVAFHSSGDLELFARLPKWPNVWREGLGRTAADVEVNRAEWKQVQYEEDSEHHRWSSVIVL